MRFRLRRRSNTNPPNPVVSAATVSSSTLASRIPVAVASPVVAQTQNPTPRDNVVPSASTTCQAVAFPSTMATTAQPAVARSSAATGTIPAAAATKHHCHACGKPIPVTQAHLCIRLPDPVGLGTVQAKRSRRLEERRYHMDCFRCVGCHGTIHPGKQYFCFDESDVVAASGSGAAEIHPFHRKCFADLFGWTCTICGEALPLVANGGAAKFKYVKHPFFENERMCPRHVGDAQGSSTPTAVEAEASSSSSTNGASTATAQISDRFDARRCAGCHRFESRICASKRFVDVGDANRCVCLACCRTLVTNSEDALPLWHRVVDFFEGPLGLLTKRKGDSDDGSSSIVGSDDDVKCNVNRSEMLAIPILIVASEALEDNLKEHSTGHYGSDQIMTRGLCLAEFNPTGVLDATDDVPDSDTDDAPSDDLTDVENDALSAEESTDVDDALSADGATDADALSAKKHHFTASITAILCLSGLPADLTASILAHEAVHAWIKLHPQFRYDDPIPLVVEEGVCQLVAFLFLNDASEDHRPFPLFTEEILAGVDDDSSLLLLQLQEQEKKQEHDNDGTPSDEKLRQYFKFCIETDDSVYGEGFRLAASAYSQMGMRELLHYVVVHKDFPEIV